MGEADPSPGPGGPPLSEPGRTLQSPAVPSGPQKPAVGLRFCGFRVHHTMIFNVRVAGTPPPLAPAAAGAATVTAPDPPSLALMAFTQA